MTLGEKIQLLRKQNSMTQEQLAERLTITRQTVSKWELGESEPDITYIIQLSDIFQVTTDHLIKDAPNTLITTDFPSEKESSLHGKVKIFMGCIFTLIGVFGILAFWVISIVNPVYTNQYGYEVNQSLFGGLQNFLHAWNARGLFWFIVLIGAVGIILLFFPDFWENGGSAIEDAEDMLDDYIEDKQRVEQYLKKLEKHTK